MLKFETFYLENYINHQMTLYLHIKSVKIRCSASTMIMKNLHKSEKLKAKKKT